MQDRIKELAIEVGMGFNQRLDEFSTPFYDGVHVEQLTRFAKAIARECAEIVEERAEALRAMNSKHEAAQVEMAADEIYARFGIAKE